MLNLNDIENQIIKYGKHIGWSKLTSIQKKAIPVIIRKKNSLLVAPTGSGKTEAAVLPLFIILSNNKTEKKGIRALYITPLRALNRDIHRRIIKYAEDLRLSANIRHGDTSKSSRLKMVQNPPDILITTPETLAIILTSRKMRENLRTLEWVIIDELHELIGSERGAHLSLSLERVELLAEKKIIRIALSATLGNLSEASRFLVGSDKKAAVIVDQSIRRYDIQLQYIKGSFKEIADQISNYINKRLSKGKSAILFTNTRDEAEHLGALLKSRSTEIPIDVHHGSLSKNIREDTEHNLKDGVAGMVVSTSSLELGLDIGEVDLVIQLGSSRQSIKLIQRIGRSRHQIGESAQGLVITHRLDDELEALSLINRIRAGSLETNRIQDCALDVLTHHLVGLVIEYGQVNIKDMLPTIKKSYPFKKIKIEEVEHCIDLLVKQRILRYNGEIARRNGSNTYTFYYNNISTIPDIQQFDVIDIVSNRTVGRLDQIFIGEYGEPERIFTLKGTSWKIISIDEINKEVNVEPIFEDNSTIPYWIGELIPVDLKTSKEVGKIRRLIDLKKDFDVSFDQLKRINKTKEILGYVPDERSITLEKKEGTNILIIHSCFGSKINQTLATLLSTIISSKNGSFVDATSDPYRIFLSSKTYLDSQTVYDFFNNEIDIKEVLSVAVIGTHPLNWKTWYVAKKFGVIGKEAQYDKRASRLIQERYKNTALYREVIRELLFDKYDILNTKKIFEDVKSRKIKIFKKLVQEFTPLALPILQQSSHFAALPVSIDKTILELVKERLENKRQRLVCISCGKWETVRKTVDLKSETSCRICKSRLIAVTYANDNDLAKIIVKKKRKKLTFQEEKIFRRAWKTSSLVHNFGYRAIITLSGFGIGADTAARILRKFSEDDDVYKDIYNAEKNFISTRNFWDS
jgi:ATP-dependent Lhr-like helicase